MTLTPPKPRTAFARLGNRLALFHESADHVEYWRRHWNSETRKSLLARGANGELGEFEQLFVRYLPKHRVILEAGCGCGHLVAALKVRGYDVVGIDYEPQVVAFLNQELPQLNIREGNILQLPYNDGQLGAYISVGVVEHFLDGPSAALSEAWRVSDKDTVLFICVPFLNPLRRQYLSTLTSNTPDLGNLAFHQYYFSEDDFTAELRATGLHAIHTFPYACEAFLTREHPAFRHFWNSRVGHTRLRPVMRRWMAKLPNVIRSRYAHMIMCVCKCDSHRSKP